MQGRAKRVAIVTGGAGAIGTATAKRLMAMDYAVLIADLCVETAMRPARGAKAVRPATYKLDVADVDAVHDMVARVEKAMGPISVLVNAAGGATGCPFVKTPPQLLDQMLGVNLRGPFYCAQACARSMIARRYGRIVNIASHSALLGSSDRAAYAASKGGIVAATRAMAVELAPFGITVNAIAPGPIDVPRHARGHDTTRRKAWAEVVPVGRYGTPDEVASAAAYLVGDSAGYITGQVIAIDGGFTAAGLVLRARKR
jgi:NAD(P)-dependent dehydrogenase (short-subunit alcohol dehydrogenase family)